MRTLVLRGETIPLEKPFAGEWRGYTYTCATCGEQWAKATLSTRGSFINTTFPCPSHGDRHRPGGSILRPFLWWDHIGGTISRTLSNLPRALVEYEVTIRLRQILKG